MPKVTWRTGAVIVAAFTAIPIITVSSPAAADTNCGSWPGNGIAHHDIASRSATVSGRTVKVALVNHRISDHSFAAIRSGYRSGDQTWIDRSKDKASWTQCGPFSSQFSNDQLHKGYWMRACARFNGYSFCTDWKQDS
ncbi:hypothetical protein [Herbidospora cretacea]|uniref:hypothetical protein n=1 Tax=Herbidospora cretacea TaxID=28444 RepID=UPI0007743AC3|nr:hypothetical protein [Herbidospora cretacea]